MTASPGGAAHWDQAYEQGPSARSWYEDQPTVSLRMLTLADASPDEAFVDIGGGAAPLVDVLLERGFTDLTVLDISQAGLDHARRRLGLSGDRVSWVCADVLVWCPEHRYRLWHDRAVFHFLTDPPAQQRYLDVLARAVEPGGRVVIGTFAADGPRQCSGLPVARYSPALLAERLGRKFTVLASEREQHRTPSGATQPFTWILAERHPGDAPAGN